MGHNRHKVRKPYKSAATKQVETAEKSKSESDGMFGRAKDDPMDFADWQELSRSFKVLYGKDRSTSLSDKQKIVAYAISMGWVHDKIALQAGINRRTIGRWLQQDDFKKFVNAAKYVSGVDKVMEFFSDRAVIYAKILDDLATDGVKEDTRLQAVKAALARVFGDSDGGSVTVTLRDLYDKVADIKEIRISKKDHNELN